ncbi:hypothetical protein LY78DRAFT_175647 [Colletotrichum sublineola]|nr:hypothetical protein LY78DRAFT_175647 [Colletotrichum sublineola]
MHQTRQARLGLSRVFFRIWICLRGLRLACTACSRSSGVQVSFILIGGHDGIRPPAVIKIGLISMPGKWRILIWDAMHIHLTFADTSLNSN